MKNLDLKSILSRLSSLGQTAQKYLSFALTILVLAAFGFVIYRINTFSRQQPSQDDLNTKLATVRAPKIDEEAIESIEQLEDRNIEIKALFDKARDNPFQE